MNITPFTNSQYTNTYSVDSISSRPMRDLSDSKKRLMDEIDENLSKMRKILESCENHFLSDEAKDGVLNYFQTMSQKLTDMQVAQQKIDQKIINSIHDREIFICKRSNSSNIATLFKEPVGHDITFKVEDQSIPVHYDIIRGRCPILEEIIIAAQSREDNNNNNVVEVQIDHFSANSFRNILEYFYTNNININANNCIQTYLCADWLQLENVKETIRLQMDQCINDSNVITHLIELQHRSLNDPLVQYVMSFVLENAINIFVNDQIYRIPQTILLNLLKDDKLNLPEIEIAKLAIQWLNGQNEDTYLAKTVLSCLRINAEIQSEIKALNLKIWNRKFDHYQQNEESQLQSRIGTWFLPLDPNKEFQTKIEGTKAKVLWRFSRSLLKNSRNIMVFKSPNVSIGSIDFCLQIIREICSMAFPNGNRFLLPKHFSVSIVVAHQVPHEVTVAAKVALVHNKQIESSYIQQSRCTFKNNQLRNPIITLNINHQDVNRVRQQLIDCSRGDYLYIQAQIELMANNAL